MAGGGGWGRNDLTIQAGSGTGQEPEIGRVAIGQWSKGRDRPGAPTLAGAQGGGGHRDNDRACSSEEGLIAEQPDSAYPDA